MQYDVFGMCNALYDIQAEVTDAQLEALGLSKGGMFLIDDSREQEILQTIEGQIVNTDAGGSGANTMIGIALLGGKTSFTSRVGQDKYGEMYTRSLTEKSVKANLARGEGRTGVSIILVTPDAQRTMCTYLGMSQNLQKEDILLDDLKDSSYLYVTGYLWDSDSQKEAVLQSMDFANKHGVRVALSLSDSFCVNRHKEDFLNILRRHVDIVFGNASEVKALTDTEDPYEAARALGDFTDIVVVTMDETGSFIRQEDSVYDIPSYKVQAVDTTGAGDMYAAGLLYGLTRQLDMFQTGKIAAYCAAQIVSKMGPRLNSIDMSEIDKIKS
jgi:sugar/nucleoside kinase (ribokinase family)